MPAKFDAIEADDDSARRAHIDSRAHKAVRETERLCRVHRDHGAPFDKLSRS
jgi:hypothetical protein